MLIAALLLRSTESSFGRLRAPTRWCPAGCSNRGVCEPGYGCRCDEDFRGVHCQLKACRDGCGLGGTCLDSGVCVCAAGHFGAACELNTCGDGSACAGHGLCVAKRCRCSTGWNGYNCSTAAAVSATVPLRHHRSCASCVHGTCIDGTCFCAKDWMGTSCSVPLGGVVRPKSSVAVRGAAAAFGCASSGCAGHGTCTNGITCQCTVGWSGVACEVSLCGYPNGDCAGHGHCTTTGCRCRGGWAGAACAVDLCGAGPGGVKCSGHGACGARGCSCAPGWLGAHCDSTMCGLSLRDAHLGRQACSGHGVCSASGCNCAAAWGGTFCSASLCGTNSSLGAPTCSGHGVCSASGCECDVGYSGHMCSVSLCGGGALISARNDCSGHGHCSTQGCDCHLSWMGKFCSKSLCGASATCSGHGICGRGESGACKCSPGWHGATCDVSICGPKASCSAHGQCTDSGCECDDGWIGRACSATICGPGAACSDHGSCTADGCMCELGWNGVHCETSSCGEVVAAPSAAGAFGSTVSSERWLQPPCSAHGVCTANGCDCSVGFHGALCADEMCGRANACSGHGLCTASGCACAVGFRGSDCAETSCGANAACSGHGTCTADGCECNTGFKGATCAGDRCGVGNRCNGHGECTDDGCECWTGYRGTLCATESCGVGNRCSGHGQCGVDGCECASGWRGALCAVDNCGPAGRCSGHGRCDGGMCTCMQGWGKGFCAEAVCPAQCLNGGECARTTTRHGVAAAGCRCPKGWEGPTCEVPEDLWCSKKKCSSRGTCVGSALMRTCACSTLWKGQRCETPWDCGSNSSCGGHGKCTADGCACDKWFGGRHCTEPWDCGDGMDCSSHGTCSAAGCACDAAWSDKFCNISSAASCARDVCHGRGFCRQPIMDFLQNEAAATGDRKALASPFTASTPGSRSLARIFESRPARSGVAAVPVSTNVRALLEGLGGAHWKESGATDRHWSQRGGASRVDVPQACICKSGFGGSHCENDLFCGPNGHCHAHGKCVDSQCQCERGWHGDTCDVSLCSLPGRDKCSGHGECTDDGTCSCAIGYLGDSCEVAVCGDDARCSDQGKCTGSYCACNMPWMGKVCDERICGETGDCNARGTCTVDGCLCIGDFVGAGCEHTCGPEKKCSSHGKCTPSGCRCDMGWRGEECDATYCPGGLLSPGKCSGHGTCTPNGCICEESFHGPSCECKGKCKCGPGDRCSDHGTCGASGACVCDPGFSGSLCDERECPRNCSGVGYCARGGKCLCPGDRRGADCSIVRKHVAALEANVARLQASLASLRKSPKAIDIARAYHVAKELKVAVADVDRSEEEADSDVVITTPSSIAPGATGAAVQGAAPFTDARYRTRTVAGEWRMYDTLAYEMFVQGREVAVAQELVGENRSLGENGNGWILHEAALKRLRSMWGRLPAERVVGYLDAAKTVYHSQMTEWVLAERLHAASLRGDEAAPSRLGSAWRNLPVAKKLVFLREARLIAAKLVNSPEAPPPPQLAADPDGAAAVHRLSAAVGALAMQLYQTENAVAARQAVLTSPISTVVLEDEDDGGAGSRESGVKNASKFEVQVRTELKRRWRTLAPRQRAHYAERARRIIFAAPIGGRRPSLSSSWSPGNGPIRRVAVRLALIGVKHATARVTMATGGVMREALARCGIGAHVFDLSVRAPTPLASGASLETLRALPPPYGAPSDAGADAAQVVAEIVCEPPHVDALLKCVDNAVETGGLGRGLRGRGIDVHVEFPLGACRSLADHIHKNYSRLSFLSLTPFSLPPFLPSRVRAARWTRSQYAAPATQGLPL